MAKELARQIASTQKTIFVFITSPLPDSDSLCSGKIPATPPPDLNSTSRSQHASTKSIVGILLCRPSDRPSPQLRFPPPQPPECWRAGCKLYFHFCCTPTAPTNHTRLTPGVWPPRLQCMGCRLRLEPGFRRPCCPRLRAHTFPCWGYATSPNVRCHMDRRPLLHIHTMRCKGCRCDSHTSRHRDSNTHRKRTAHSSSPTRLPRSAPP